MRNSGFICVSAALALYAVTASAQVRTVAITVDDLPYAGGTFVAPIDPQIPSTAEMVNRKLLAAFQRHQIPVTGFVIQKRVESLGTAAGTRILKDWISRGFDLGNHTGSHPDINDCLRNRLNKRSSTASPQSEPSRKVQEKGSSSSGFP
jgi:peptidoglycan/xylan/chitin deacetylase (PgdA/CDA1 family)